VAAVPGSPRARVTLTGIPGLATARGRRGRYARAVPAGRGAFFEASTARSGMTPLEGARPQLRAVTDPRARGGELYAPRFGSNGPPVRRPILRRFHLQKQIDVLWEVSERETDIPLDVAAAGTT
jgi:hypothetical protein